MCVCFTHTHTPSKHVYVRAYALCKCIQRAAQAEQRPINPNPSYYPELEREARKPASRALKIRAPRVNLEQGAPKSKRRSRKQEAPKRALPDLFNGEGGDGEVFFCSARVGGWVLL